jgi:hypothetical protein
MGKVSSDYILAVKQPAIAAQWHPSRNVRFTPHASTPSFRKRISCLCRKGHERQNLNRDGTKGEGRPECDTERRRFPLQKVAAIDGGEPV